MPGAVTLAAILQARTAGLAEPEVWSLLCQAAQALQDLFLAKKACLNVPRVSPSSLWLTSRGRVTLLPDSEKPVPLSDKTAARDPYLAPEYAGQFRNTNEVDIEKMWIFSLGQTLTEAVNTEDQKLTQLLDNLLTAMTRPDPKQRATLMVVLNVISDFCKIRLDCKPFSHVAMDLYRGILDGSPPPTLCLPNTANSTLSKDFTKISNTPKPGIGKSCSLKELRPPRRVGVHRVPSHLYRVASSVQDMPAAKYTCPNMCIGPEFVIRASNPSKVIHFYGKKTSRSQKVTIVLLDGQRLSVYCDPSRVTARQLFEVVMQVERMEENFFLGLTVLLNGDLFFLCPDTRLCKVARREGNKVLQACGLTLYLRIKFYLPSLRGVCRWASKHLLYLQLRRCLLEQQIRCDTSEHVVLGGLALQAEFGDYNADDHGGGEYFLLEHYIPEGLLGSCNRPLGLALCEQHQRRWGLDPGRAEEMFIVLAQSLNAYGLHFYAVTCVKKNNTSCDMWLAVGGQGIHLYDKRGDDRDLHKLYVWKNIEKLCYSKQYFILYPRCDVKGIIPVKYKFQLDQNKCLFVFYLASQHHQFFLKLRIELSSLHSLSREFGVSISNLGKKNKKLFYVENHQPLETPLGHTVRGLLPNVKHRSQTPTSSLDTTLNIEEHQNKENEQPGSKRLNTDLVIKNNSLKSKEQHTQCLPYFLQYPSEPDKVTRTDSKTGSYPRRHRVKMGTRVFSSIPKELSASQDTHVSLSLSTCSSPPEAYSLRSPHNTRTSYSPTCSSPHTLNWPQDTHTFSPQSTLKTTQGIYTSYTPTCLTPHSLISTHNTHTSLPPLSMSPLEAYVVNSSIKSTDETFHLNENESLSDSLITKFNKISFTNERILRALKLTRDGSGSLGIQITEGSDGGLYIQSSVNASVLPGDQLLAVDGHSLLQMKYGEAVDFLQSRGTELNVVISQVYHKEHSYRTTSPGGSRVICCEEVIAVNNSPPDKMSRGWSYPAQRTPNGIRAVCCVLPDE